MVNFDNICDAFHCVARISTHFELLKLTFEMFCLKKWHPLTYAVAYFTTIYKVGLKYYFLIKLSNFQIFLISFMGHLPFPNNFYFGGGEGSSPSPIFFTLGGAPPLNPSLLNKPIKIRCDRN